MKVHFHVKKTQLLKELQVVIAHFDLKKVGHFTTFTATKFLSLFFQVRISQRKIWQCIMVLNLTSTMKSAEYRK
jgi:hypothetical protein